MNCTYERGEDGEFGLLKSGEITLEGPSFRMPISQLRNGRIIRRTDMPTSSARSASGEGVWDDLWYKDHPLEAVKLADEDAITLRPLLCSTEGSDEMHGHEAIIDFLVLFSDNPSVFEHGGVRLLALARSDTQKDRYVRIGVCHRVFGDTLPRWTVAGLDKGKFFLGRHKNRGLGRKWIASLETKRFVVI